MSSNEEHEHPAPAPLDEEDGLVRTAPEPSSASLSPNTATHPTIKNN
jgi:hypothetical protein